jgi:RHS repeat-associated protein
LTCLPANIYAYDHLNRITQIKKNNDNYLVAEYSYDAMGRRVEKYDAIATATTRYYYDNQRVLLETEDTGSGFNDARYFVFGNYIDEVLLMKKFQSPTGDYYFGHDHLYSPAVLFDSSGEVKERYEYDAYGKANVYDDDFSQTYTSSQWGNPYYFTGQRQDYLDNNSLKLMYYRSRYYDTYTGRFLQQDPLGVMPDAQLPNRFAVLGQYTDGMNLYEYAISNPVIQADPYGEGCVVSFNCRLTSSSMRSECTRDCEYLCLEKSRHDQYLTAVGIQCEDLPKEKLIITVSTQQTGGFCCWISGGRWSKPKPCPANIWTTRTFLLEKELPSRDCSRSECRDGCDLVKEIADEACDLIKDPVGKRACKAAAAAARQACYDVCNAWCRNP